MSNYPAYVIMSARGRARPVPAAPPPAVRGLAPPVARGRARPRPREAFAAAPLGVGWQNGEDEAEIDVASGTDAVSVDPALRGRSAPIDVKELLKLEAFGSAAADCDNHFEKNRPCPDEVWGVSDQYLMLDTYAKLETSEPDKGRYSWNFQVQGVSTSQNAGMRDVADTVIEAEIGEFCTPLPPDIPYTDNPAPGTTFPALPILTPNPGPPYAVPANPLDGVMSQIAYCGAITVEMMEIGLQSVSDIGGVRHHFVLALTPASSGDRLHATPQAGFETYIFTDPIQDVHGLTLAFRNPDYAVAFPRDVYPNVGAVVAAGQLLQFNAPGHNLVAGDRVFFQSFASASPTINNWVNRTQGQVVGAGVVAGVSFRLDPDVDVTPLGLAVGATIPVTQPTTLRIAKNRMRIPLRLRRVVSRLTNYITPV